MTFKGFSPGDPRPDYVYIDDEKFKVDEASFKWNKIILKTNRPVISNACKQCLFIFALWAVGTLSDKTRIVPKAKYEDLKWEFQRLELQYQRSSEEWVRYRHEVLRLRSELGLRDAWEKYSEWLEWASQLEILYAKRKVIYSLLHYPDHMTTEFRVLLERELENLNQLLENSAPL